MEYYSDLGKIGHIEPWNKQDNRIYGVIDVDMKTLQFNFGVGYLQLVTAHTAGSIATVQVPTRPVHPPATIVDF